MCGIAGALYTDYARPAELVTFRAMGSAIAHRGPDAEGFLLEPGVGLVHRRLSIIDLAGGDQPIGNEDGSVQVVFNGEIYNYQALRNDLEARGHSLRTRSDTEVLVHLYEECGERLVERLRGMFAFAIWDRPRRRLLLARDRIGIKPLYYYRGPEELVFASEPKAILEHPGVPREVDPEALEDYLAYGVVLGSRSIFRGIERLLPGHTLLIEPGCWDRSPRRYWRLQMDPEEGRSATDWEEALAAKFEEAVRYHLIADVPVGAFLSGGIDSGSVVAAAAARGAGELRTFTMGFEEEGFSELPAAREVAQRFGTQHTEQVVRPDAVSLLDELTRFYDEPFADSSSIPTYLVSKLASRSVKVALSGDGGDEAFGGYRRYAHDLREAAVRERLPAWLRRGVCGPLGSVWPKADWLPRPLRWKTALVNLGSEPDTAYANTLALCRPPLRRRLMSPALVARLNGHQPERLVRDAFGSTPIGDPLGGMIAADVATVLPDDFLVKVDRASMACGLEVRPPLLDHELMELAAKVPSRWKVREGQTKWIFKQVARRYLPESILDRPKQGFEVPINAWLRGPLRDMFEEAVLDRNAPVASLLDVQAASRLYASHRSGTSRSGPILWSLLVLARWAERYLKHEAPSTECIVSGRPVHPSRSRPA